MSLIERSFALTAKGYDGRVLFSYDSEDRLLAIDLSEITHWKDVQKQWLISKMPATLAGIEQLLNTEVSGQKVFSWVQLPTAAPDFDTFWVAYPATSAEKGAKIVAQELYQKLTKEEKGNAWAFLPTYKKNLTKSGQFPMHVKTYLRQKLWIQ